MVGQMRRTAVDLQPHDIDVYSFLYFHLCISVPLFHQKISLSVFIQFINLHLFVIIYVTYVNDSQYFSRILN